MNLFIIIYTYSLLVGKIALREIGFFEHVNLLGNVIVFLLILIIYFDLPLKYKIALTLIGFLSTSTGSFLITLTSFLPIRQINVRTFFFYFLVSVFSFFCFYLLLLTFNPILHNKVFGIFNVFQELSFNEFLSEVRRGSSVQEINKSVTSSLVWRVYAWCKYYIYFLDKSSLCSMIFGHGVMNFKLVWDGIMPHNDFILILFDFGLIIFGLFIYTVFKIVWISCKKKNLVILFILLLFILRLFTENVIYSYYTFQIFILIFAIIKTSYEKENFMYNCNVPFGSK
ncbi:hypothetical protein [Flammeovirga aprica]|uniref:O-antigen ligase domain-containing protein n=1 Tax=Flammeovirga aprica JL-4 TaxID=694437 RepID=A0A7X9P179_9BACT|nr:hypothetical protein [Flammeovirga aprica]NME67671.1 hypothetical protein [Flammeovirga aprica JL-4]